MKDYSKVEIAIFCYKCGKQTKQEILIKNRTPYYKCLECGKVLNYACKEVRDDEEL